MPRNSLTRRIVSAPTRVRRTRRSISEYQPLAEEGYTGPPLVFPWSLRDGTEVSPSYTIQTYNIQATASDTALITRTEPVQSEREVLDTTYQALRETSPAPPVTQQEPIVVAPPPEPEPTLLTKYGKSVSGKLINTICKYKGKWVYIENATDSYYLQYEPGKISYFEIDPWDEERKTVMFDDAFVKDFEFDQYKLGYFNSKDVCLYVTRRLGYSSNALGIGMNSITIPRGLIAYKEPGFIDMLNGVYPTANEALNIVGIRMPEKMIAKAFSTKACFIRKSLSVAALYYMGEQVGEILLKREVGFVPNLEDVTLYPSYSHLVGYFQESCNFTPKVLTD